MLTKFRIKNPLTGIPRDQLIKDVEEFAAEFQITELTPYLIKGALVAQSPSHIDKIVELDDEDRRILAEEVTHRWRHPKALYLTIILNSVAAAIQGWDQTGMPQSRFDYAHAQMLTSMTGSNGANLSFAIALGIPDDDEHCLPLGGEALCAKNAWLVGMVNSMPYIAICLL
jgi:hypothetical protein